MYSSSKHKDLVKSIHEVQRAVEDGTLKENIQGARLEKKLLDIDDHLVTLIELLKDNKRMGTTVGTINPELLPGNHGDSKGPKGHMGAINSEPLHNVSMEPDSTEEQEEYQSPDEPVYKHFYYYDVEDVTDSSHSKYSRLADIASDLGASDSAPHYAMVKKTLFLGRYLINKVDTKVKINVKPKHENEEEKEQDSIQIV